MGLLCTDWPQTGAQQTRHLNCCQADGRMQHNWCSMFIQHRNEGERARKGRMIPWIEEREIGRLWQCKRVIVITIITGALGTISKGFRTWIRKIEMKNYCDLMQKGCLLVTAKFIRKALNTWGCVLQLSVKDIWIKWIRSIRWDKKLK